MLFSELVSDCFALLDHDGRRLGEKNCAGTNPPAPQALYDNTAARAGVAYPGTYRATAAHQVARGNAAGQKSKTRAGTAAEPMSNLTFITPHRDQNELANSLKHEGIRVGEIIAYRAWRVIEPSCSRPGDDRLHSVFVRDYVWPPDEPASGDVKMHGIYSFRDVICSREEYGYSPWAAGHCYSARSKSGARSWSMKPVTGHNSGRS